MRRKGLFILFIVIVSGWLSSCRRDISFKLPAPPPLLVIEGRIETDSVPYVIVTRNSPYFGTIQLGDLNNIYVHGAIVKVSDGIDTVTLPEITFDSLGVKVGVYVNPFSSFRGQANKTYHLWVQAGDQKVSSVTTIPASYPLDSIWVVENTVADKPQLVTLMCRFKAPATPGFYARYFTKRNRQPFYPGVNSVYDDGLVYGTTFNFQLARGINMNDTSAFKDFGYFYKGDTIQVKWCNIDFATYNFWRTLEAEARSQGPFSSPIIVQSNITGGLGVWSGYNSSYKKVIAPK